MQLDKHTADRENQVKAMIMQQLGCAKELLQGHRVVLYGSRVHGNPRPRSDFDIGVWGTEPLPLKAFYKLEDMMEELPTLYKIDLVDLNRTSEEFQQQALRHVETLYE
jgi:predicted nucleotidyltransferase